MQSVLSRGTTGSQLPRSVGSAAETLLLSSESYFGECLDPLVRVNCIVGGVMHNTI